MPGSTLVVFFSKGGASGDYARIVAETLRGRGHRVDLVDLRREPKPDLSGYDNVVVGTGVRITRVYRRGRKFLRRRDLAGKRLAIFLASGIAVDDAAASKRRFLEPLLRKLGLEPVMCDAFPGLVPGDDGKLEDRTEPDRARRWAEELAARLEETAAAATGPDGRA